MLGRTRTVAAFREKKCHSSGKIINLQTETSAIMVMTQRGTRSGAKPKGPASSPSSGLSNIIVAVAIRAASKAEDPETM